MQTPAELNKERQGQRLPMQDADVIWFPSFFEPGEADCFFTALTDNISWKQANIKIYGREMLQPRLIAWYGDAGMSYTYSGTTLHPHPWTAELLDIRRHIEPVGGVVFNSVLLNLYRNERDSVSWHADDEAELGKNPVIASVSFGATRRFQFKHKFDPQQKAEVNLSHGSLLLMRGITQHYWKHQIPKTKQPCGPRINLTFRIIV
jgi:alkylated DNA repair dioxygenase AlkB